jgi:tetratricopeptide (TPR) repeat protein
MNLLSKNQTFQILFLGLSFIFFIPSFFSQTPKKTTPNQQKARETFEKCFDSVYVEDKFSAALSKCSEALKLDPLNSSIYLNRGVAYFNLKKYQSALKDFRQSIKLDPENYDAYRESGKTYANLKNYNLAIKEFSKAIKLLPQNDESNTDELIKVYQNRAMAFESIGKKDLAQADRKKIEELRGQK